MDAADILRTYCCKLGGSAMLKKAIGIARVCISLAALAYALLAALELPTAYKFDRGLAVDSDQVTTDWLIVAGGLTVWFWLSGRRTKLFAKLSREYNSWVEK
jgi:hypothetical protein